MSTSSTPSTGSIPPRPSHLPEPDLSETAQKVLAERYHQPGETPADMFWRVAWSVASVDSSSSSSSSLTVNREPGTVNLAAQFYNLMSTLRFLPNSPTLMNAGTELGQLSACFVLPVEDSMEGIFEAVKQAALIHKSGGGTGFSFSRLRAANSPVKSTNGVASGPLSFMQVFDAATNTVKQGSKRRGANMGILRVDHPDIEDFIKAKDEDGILPNFNLSVGLTEDFMDAYHKDHSYSLIDPATREAVGQLQARFVMELIVEHAWKNGEPGVIFLDTVNAHNPTPWLGDIEATNPCGEEPLLPYESCNLGSINLSKYVTPEPHEVQPGYPTHRLDWDALDHDVRLAVLFLDNVIDLNNYPLPEIREATLKTRKIGLGVMGWADALIKLGIPYHYNEAVELAEKVMGYIKNCAHSESMALAADRVVCPAFKCRLENPEGGLRRNAARTCIAPTGTLSMIADCSPGIEPLYALAQTKTCLDGTKFTQMNEELQALLGDDSPFGESATDILRHVKASGRIPGESGWTNNLPMDLLEPFVTAHEIAPETHLAMQAAFQKHCDAAVSKTINLPAGAGIDDVRRIFEEAHHLGCKGVTLYRDGSRGDQVLTAGTGVRGQEAGDRRQETGSGDRQDPSSPPDPCPLSPGPSLPGTPAPAPRPSSLPGHTHKLPTGMGALYVTVNELEGRPFEVFTTIGRSGRSVTAKTEAIGRLVSLCLRSDISLQAIIKQLDGIIGETPQFHDGGLVKSVPDAIARILKQYLPSSSTESTGSTTSTSLSSSAPTSDLRRPISSFSPCPDCNGPLQHQEGCLLCASCGFSKCG